MKLSALLAFCVVTAVSSLRTPHTLLSEAPKNLDDMEDMDYSDVFTKHEEKNLKNLESILSLYEPSSFFQSDEEKVADEKLKIVFVRDRQWDSTIPRGDEMSKILTKMGHESKMMNCGKFCVEVNKTQEHVDVLVHIKVRCKCGYNYAGSNIYDPIDNMEKYGDILSDWTKVFSGTDAMRDNLNKGNKDFSLTMPHHHSNFQNRRHQEKPAGKPLLIGIAGHPNVNLTNNLATCLKSALGFSVNKVDPVMKSLGELDCDMSLVSGMSVRGDCFAMKLAQLDIGVVWSQSAKKEVQLRKPPQRLVNLLAAGVPAIAHTDMAGHHDAKAIEDTYGGTSVNMVSNEAEMCTKIANLVMDDEARKKAAADALKVAEEYSAESIGKKYLEAFEHWKGKHDVKDDYVPPTPAPATQ